MKAHIIQLIKPIHYTGDKTGIAYVQCWNWHTTQQTASKGYFMQQLSIQNA